MCVCSRKQKSSIVCYTLYMHTIVMWLMIWVDLNNYDHPELIIDSNCSRQNSIYQCLRVQHEGKLMGNWYPKLIFTRHVMVCEVQIHQWSWTGWCSICQKCGSSESQFHLFTHLKAEEDCEWKGNDEEKDRGECCHHFNKTWSLWLRWNRSNKNRELVHSTNFRITFIWMGA